MLAHEHPVSSERDDSSTLVSPNDLMLSRVSLRLEHTVQSLGPVEFQGVRSWTFVLALVLDVLLRLPLGL